MILDAVTARDLDRAIAQQVTYEFDRERLATICSASEEFLEYVGMFTKDMLAGQASVQTVMASAITLGIEIGIAIQATKLRQ